MGFTVEGMQYYMFAVLEDLGISSQSKLINFKHDHSSPSHINLPSLSSLSSGDFRSLLTVGATLPSLLRLLPGLCGQDVVSLLAETLDHGQGAA